MSELFDGELRYVTPSGLRRMEPTNTTHALHPEAACQRCGRPNVVWFAPDELWNRAMGTRDNPRGEGVIVCPVCFVQSAEQIGVRGPWLVGPGSYPVRGETASPDEPMASRLAICEAAYEDRAAEVDMLRATLRDIQNVLAAYSQPNRCARGFK